MAEFLSNDTIMLCAGIVLGAVLGSFLNVCAYRIPLGQSIVSPRSFCPQCNSPIPWFRNLPIVTWLIQGGKANCCSFKIPMRYWLVEAFSAIVFGFLFYRYAQIPDFGQLLGGCTFAWLMLAVVVIDMETMIIPDRFSMGGAVVGVLLSVAFPALHHFHSASEFMNRIGSGLDSVIGLLIGSASLYWIGILAGKALKKEALGEGDVKLMGCIGAFCGWQGSIFVIFGGATLGAVILLPIMLVGRFSSKEKEEDETGETLTWGQEVPFGPYLALAGLIYLLAMRPWVDDWFDSLFWVFRQASLG
jgi:leader peptidase (prepilin peptidase) / N-methyltransferase